MKKSLMLAATTAMLAVVLLTFASCRSHKEATATTKEEYDVEAAGSITTSTAELFQWLSRFALDIDSFEIVWKSSAEDELAHLLPRRTHDCAVGEIIMPTHHFAEIGKMVGDTANGQQDKGLYTLHNTPYTASNARLIMRGKHARLGRADIVQRDAARRAEQVDTLSAHRSIDKADHYARDNVGIAKPPDVTWWPWLLLAGICAIICHIKVKNK